MRFLPASALLVALGAAGLTGCGSEVTPVDTENLQPSTPGTGNAPTKPVPTSQPPVGPTKPTKPTMPPTPQVSYPAAHPGMPQIPDNGGVVLHDPEVVTVTFPMDPLEKFVQGFDDALGDFAWWPATTAEYGVGKMKNAGHVSIPDVQPANMLDSDVTAWLDAKIADGTLPPPTDQTIYALYYQDSTVITLQGGGGGQSCNQFLGYHDSITVSFQGKTIPVAYAVINRCGGDQGQLTTTASHEFGEAVTDPHPSDSLTYMLLDQNNPWAMSGGEVGDMCSSVSGVTEGGYQLTRLWSNKNAKAGNQPCVPVPPDPNKLPYFNAGVVHDQLHTKPGTTVSTEVDCYSFGPLPGPITLLANPFSPQNLTITFDKATCKNGDKVKMNLHLAATAPAGRNFHYQLLAQLDANTAHLWRGQVTSD